MADPEEQASLDRVWRQIVRDLNLGQDQGQPVTPIDHRRPGQWPNDDHDPLRLPSIPRQLAGLAASLAGVLWARLRRR